MANTEHEHFPFRHSRVLDVLLWRRKQKRYFVSHAYQDEAGLQDLLDALPDWIAPFQFPPIDVSPRETVSDALINAIIACDGLVYIDSAASQSSFWVHFERRFAQRRGMKVARYLPAKRQFEVDDAAPTNTTAVLWNDGLDRDDELGRQIARWLRENRSVASQRALSDLGGRYFALERHSGQFVPSGNAPIVFGETQDSLQQKVAARASFVLLLSNAACRQPWPFKDRDYLTESRDADEQSELPIEIAWLERPDPHTIASDFRLQERDDERRHFRRRVLEDARSKDALVLSDQAGINWPRVDDLLIRIEHTAFQNGTLEIHLRDAMSDELRQYEAFEKTPEQQLRRARIIMLQDKYGGL